MKDNGFNRYYCKKHFPVEHRKLPSVIEGGICEYKNCKKEPDSFIDFEDDEKVR